MTKEQKKKYIGYGILAFVIVLVCIYFGGYLYFQDKFLPNTMLNGKDISNETVEQVVQTYKEQGDSYSFEIKEKEQVLLKLLGTDMEFQYHVKPQVEKLLEEQNHYGWFIDCWSPKKLQMEERFSYQEERVKQLLDEMLKNTEAERVAPKSAEIVLEGADFVIKKEEPGTQIDVEKFHEMVLNGISEQKQNEMVIENADCYVKPAYTETTPELVAAFEKMKGYCNAQITYTLLRSQKELIDRNQIAQWIRQGENWEIAIDQEAAKAYLKELAKKYRGQIHVDKELPLLLDDIQNQRVAERKPIPVPQPKRSNIARKIYEDGNYIEVDLTNQHMWYVENGEAIFECDIVTGSPNRSTPAGVFKITEKRRNKVLTGNIVPETGEPEYKTPVAYWMRITNRGVGFHDATWQRAFGGNRYKTHGSHGCINMPYSAAQRLYSLVSVGTKTIIHY